VNAYELLGRSLSASLTFRLARFLIHSAGAAPGAESPHARVARAGCELISARGTRQGGLSKTGDRGDRREPARGQVVPTWEDDPWLLERA